GVMAADGAQPFTQGRLLDGLQNFIFHLDHVAESKWNAGRKPLEYFHQHGMSRGNASIESRAGRRRFTVVVIRKCRADALQDDLRIEWSRDRIGGAERPCLHRAMMM